MNATNKTVECRVAIKGRTLSACPNCHTDSPLYLCSKDYNHRVTDEIYSYYRCPQCGLLFIGNPPANLKKYYPDSYHNIPETLDQLHSLSSRLDEYKLDAVCHFKDQGSLLEIGPSAGGFCHLARNVGFYVEAIEMDSDCCDFISNKVGINVFQGSDIAVILKAQNKTYDVVVMWHVIEHLADIWNILELAVARLNRGGIIALASPNPDSYQFKIMGKYWPHLDAPRHLQLFPMKLLVEKFEALGMTLQSCTTTDKGARYADRFGWRYLVVRQKPRNKIFHDINRHIGGLLWRFFMPIDRIEGRGSAYTMIFKKCSD